MKPQITICDIPHSTALENHIREKAQRLSVYCSKINTCRIVVTLPQKNKHKGKLFCVRIDLTVPGKELVVNHRVGDDIYVAIYNSFRAMERRLEDYKSRRRGEIKTHNGIVRGYISKLFEEEGFGFIQGMDGNEFYFSTTNVAHPTFIKLELGDIVEFISIGSTEGFQAHRITKEKTHEWSALAAS